MNTNKFKIIVVGDAKVGKTTFIQRHLTGYFTDEYVATMGVEVDPLVFRTSEGNVVLNIWDLAGDERFEGLRDGYFIGANAAIVMFDVTNVDSYKSVRKHVRGIRNVCGDIPIILCGTKIDLEGRQVHPSMIKVHRKLNLQKYFDVSGMSNCQFEKPFLELMRKLMNKEDLMYLD